MEKPVEYEVIDEEDSGDTENKDAEKIAHPEVTEYQNTDAGSHTEVPEVQIAESIAHPEVSKYQYEEASDHN